MKEQRQLATASQECSSKKTKFLWLGKSKVVVSFLYSVRQIVGSIKNIRLGTRASTKMQVILAITVMFIIVPISLLLLNGYSASKGRFVLSKREQPDVKEHFFSSSDRILIIAPHPDDETLACGGLIKWAKDNDIPVLVVVLTNGDAYLKSCEKVSSNTNPTAEDFRRMGEVRHAEALAAAKVLGLKEENTLFLCYPDGGINSLFNTDWDYTNLHLGRNGAIKATYLYAYEKEAPYCGKNVEKNLIAISKKFKPTAVVYPDPYDSHHDHWATSAFVEYVFCKTNYEGKRFAYLIHKGPNWPFPRGYDPALELSPPPELLELDGKWTRFYLSKDEKMAKYEAVNCYASQKAARGNFLDAFVRRNELFVSYPVIETKLVKKKPDFFIGEEMPHILIKDPERDILQNNFEQQGDIKAVALALSDKNAWVAIETEGGIANEVIYEIHLRIFGKKEVSRVDVRIESGNAIYELDAKNSIKSGITIPVLIADKRMVIQIPGDFFKSADRFLLKADCFYEQRRIDRSPWRSIKLNNAH